MTFSRRDPYLWIHFAGIATLPLWLDLCLAGLAVGDPVVPPWLELGTLGLVGTLPVLSMQLRRPFYVFSLLAIAVRPDQLGENQRRLLTRQRTWPSRLSTVLGAVALLAILAWLYQLAPIAAALTPFAGQSRATGWLICAIAFLLANVFVQVPATVLPLLLAPPDATIKSQPYEVADIRRDFTVVGLRIGRILPDLADAAMITADSRSIIRNGSLTSTAAVAHVETSQANKPHPLLPASFNEHTDIDVSDRLVDIPVVLTGHSQDSEDAESVELVDSAPIPLIPDSTLADSELVDLGLTATELRTISPNIVHNLDDVLAATEAAMIAITPETRQAALIEDAKFS